MNINEIKAQEAREVEGERQMTPFERLEQYTKGNIVEGIDFKRDVEVVIQDYKLQEQYVKHLEQDKENMKKIINILCDTISQLI